MAFNLSDEREPSHRNFLPARRELDAPKRRSDGEIEVFGSNACRPPPLIRNTPPIASQRCAPPCCRKCGRCCLPWRSGGTSLPNVRKKERPRRPTSIESELLHIPIVAFATSLPRQ